MAQYFYPTVEIFESATKLDRRRRTQKNTTLIWCPACPRRRQSRVGKLFQVEQPRARWGLNQVTYRCEQCGSEHIVQFREES